MCWNKSKIKRKEGTEAQNISNFSFLKKKTEFQLAERVFGYLCVKFCFFPFLFLLSFTKLKKNTASERKTHNLLLLQGEMQLGDIDNFLGKNKKGGKQNILSSFGRSRRSPRSDSRCGNESLGQAGSVCSHQCPPCQNKCVYLL